MSLPPRQLAGSGLETVMVYVVLVSIVLVPLLVFLLVREIRLIAMQSALTARRGRSCCW